MGKLGRSRFEGFDAEGFQMNHIDCSWLGEGIRFLFPLRDVTARLWVDVETALPVRIEMVVDADRGLLNGFQPVHAEFTAYDFEWNAEIPAGIFDPNIPADYTRIELGPASENALTGVGGPLSLFAMGLAGATKVR
jgi:hypothetical protein